MPRTGPRRRADPGERRAYSPIQNDNPDNETIFESGQGGSRTLTSVSPTTFEAVASADSATCPD